VDALVSHIDIAPTFLEAAGVEIPKEMRGHSLLALLIGNQADISRPWVYFERERHANSRAGDASYPSRAIRTDHYLYVRNFRPDAWPAGDPQMWKAVGPFGDIDGGPTKDFLLEHRSDLKFMDLFELACGKRPAEELYDLKNDPYAMHNIALYPEHAEALGKLRAQTSQWISDTGDPRATGGGAYEAFDKYPYYGGIDRQGKSGAQATTRP
jgi:arylsulfatase A-like enzyme